MKSKHITLPLAVILALTLSSCGKDAPVVTGGASAVRLDVAIASSRETKAIAGGTNFPRYATMGLFICKHEADTLHRFEEYSAKFNNIQANQSSSMTASPVWSYKYNGTGTAFNTIILIKPKGAEARSADFYAYAPFVSGVTSPRSIPFSLQTSINDLPDLMCAEENATGENSDRMPAGDTIKVSYHFVHKLARLQCKFILKNDDQTGTLGPGSSSDSQNKCTVNSIRIRRKGATPLYTSGTFDAIAGTFAGTAADSLTVTYAQFTDYSTGTGIVWYPTFGTKGKTYDLLLVPEKYLKDGDYELVFTIDGKELETTYPIKVGDVTHSDSTTVGFKGGYSYIFTFTYDNYQHISLSGTQIDSDANWTVNPEKKEFII